MSLITFSKFCESFQQIIEMKDLETSKLAVGVNSKSSVMAATVFDLNTSQGTMG